MILENDYFVEMNHKKISRNMRKKNMAKATQEHKTLPNHYTHPEFRKKVK
jgi:putative transposase